MSRRLRALVALLVVSFAFAATACAGTSTATGPRGPSFKEGCDTSNSNTC